MSESLVGMDNAEELVHIIILLHEDKYFRIGKNLSEKDRVEVLLTLAWNLDLFAWSAYDVLEVDLVFIIHRLNVDPLVPPKKQWLRRAAKPHIEAVKEEVE